MMAVEWSAKLESMKETCKTDAIMADEFGLHSYGSMLGLAIDAGPLTDKEELKRSEQHQMSMAESDDMSGLEAVIAEGFEWDSMALGAEHAKTTASRQEARMSQDASLRKTSEPYTKGIALQEAKKSRFVGDSISIDFGSNSFDMDRLQKKTRKNWHVIADGNVTIIDKEIIDISLAGHLEQEYIGNASDMVRLFGFTNKTLGISNVASNRFWTTQPGLGSDNKSSGNKSRPPELAYGIKVLNVPDGFYQWDVHIKYLRPPPFQLEVFPNSDAAYRDPQGNLYLAFICGDEGACRDNTIQISHISFTPVKLSKKGKKTLGHMQSPEAALSNPSSNLTNATNGMNGTNGTNTDVRSPEAALSDPSSNLSNTRTGTNFTNGTNGTATDVQSSEASLSNPSSNLSNARNGTNGTSGTAEDAQSPEAALSNPASNLSNARNGTNGTAGDAQSPEAALSSPASNLTNTTNGTDGTNSTARDAQSPEAALSSPASNLTNTMDGTNATDGDGDGDDEGDIDIYNDGVSDWLRLAIGSLQKLRRQVNPLD